MGVRLLSCLSCQSTFACCQLHDLGGFLGFQNFSITFTQFILKTQPVYLLHYFPEHLAFLPKPPCWHHFPFGCSICLALPLQPSFLCLGFLVWILMLISHTEVLSFSPLVSYSLPACDCFLVAWYHSVCFWKHTCLYAHWGGITLLS